ncbi:peptidase family M50 [Methanobrevibacter oralis]|uniref:Peptidase family M50 n=2 Tax=Methanobrevibacter oralis TaxID=66851 RepID=A0A166BRY1_METOA|nr:peptidase family M50 [Methanobrevibacter oralis]
MNGIYYYLVVFFIIWILSLSLKNKLTNHGFEIEFPVIMWKTKKLRGLISKISNISPKFWKWYMNIGIIISFIAMLVITWLLISAIPTAFETPSVSLIIPGVEIPGSTIFIPFVSGIIALATCLIVHEFSHGVISISEKISIKSIGLLLFAIIPGAFVEPDEDELKKSSKLSQLRVYAAGSIANITLALVAILILSMASGAIPHYFDENGIEISRVLEDSPASGVLKEGMVIKSLDNKSIVDSKSYVDAINQLKPNDTLSIVTNQGEFNLTLDKNPNNESLGYIGIQSNYNYKLVDNSLGPLPWILFSIVDLFNWIFILNLGIGLFNLLPIKPLDGGKMLEILLSYKLDKKQYKPIVNSLSMVLAMVIIFSLIAGFI